MTGLKKTGMCFHTFLYENEPFPAQEDFDMCVIMGEYMNIYEEEAFPWLNAKCRKNFYPRNDPLGEKVLGICLGAQLIADCLGEVVRKNKYRNGNRLVSRPFY